MTRMRLRQLTRMLTIQRVLVKHGLDEIVWRTHLFRPLAWLGRLLAFGRRRLPLGVRLRQALEELGPVFVKFGQALSVRPDLLPPDIAAELAKLQDQVPPFAARAGSGRAHAPPSAGPSSKCSPNSTREPLAAASIAQVHAARLRERRGRRREGPAAERRGADSARRRGAVRDRRRSPSATGPRRIGSIPSRSSRSSSGRSPSSSI